MGIGYYEMLQFIIIGAAGGAMGGFFGVGAAIIMIPLLVFWVFPALQTAPDMIVHLALGTSLAIVIPTALSGSFTHAKAGNVSWGTVLYLVATGLSSCFLGSALAAKLGAALLKSLFALLIAGVAIQMFLQRKDAGQVIASAPRPVPTLVVGLLVGLFSGFFGVGGGIIAIPLMVRYLGMPIHRAVGTSLAFVFFTAIVGTIGYIVHGWQDPGLPRYSLGYVYAPGWLLSGIPSIFLAQWGALWARKTKPVRLQQAFALLLAVVAARMLWDSLCVLAA